MTSRIKDQTKPVSTRYSVKSPSRGGARSNSGRPIGSKNKESYTQVLQELELQTGQSFSKLLVSNYLDARNREDWNLVCRYDHMIFNKLAPDLFSIDLTIDVLDEKQKAFEEAIEALSKTSSKIFK